MGDVILALDPGQRTGWALIRKADRVVLGMGDLGSDELGVALDLLIRAMNRQDYVVEAVVEQMPSPVGIGGSLEIELKFVRRVIDHWLDDVYEVPITYVLPGVWKTSALARTTDAPSEFNRKPCSQHAKDAYLMGFFHVRKVVRA